MWHGLYIWKLSRCPSIADTISILKDYGISAVSIKVANGVYRSNLYDADGNWTGNDNYLQEYIWRLREAGIGVHGWHFIFPAGTLSPKRQAEVASTVCDAYRLQSLQIDAENVPKVGAHWSTDPKRRASAVEYMNNLSPINPCAFSLCAYRFPSLHPTFPTSEFITHPKSDHVSPQVYWAGAHNAGEQLIDSYHEHDAIRKISDGFPFVPIGAMYGEHYNIGGTAVWWEPTARDITEFCDTAAALGIPGAWWYSLDYVWKDKRWDWLGALTNSTGSPPPVVPPPVIPELPKLVKVRASYGLNVRIKRPWGTVVGKFPDGLLVPVDGLDTDSNGRKWWRQGIYYFAEWLTDPV